MDSKKFQEGYWKQNKLALQERHKIALKLIDKGPVLDLGCGDGLLLKKLKEKKIECEGLDLSNEAVSKAKKRGAKARQFDFTTEKLPYTSNKFENILLLDVLEHLFQPENILKEASRVGKNIILTVPNFAYAQSRLESLLGKIPQVLSRKKGHAYYFNEKELIRIINLCNLKIERIEYYFPLSNIPLIGYLSKNIGKLRPSFFSTLFAAKLSKK